VVYFGGFGGFVLAVSLYLAEFGSRVKKRDASVQGV
jgi:hypothetical protein